MTRPSTTAYVPGTEHVDITAPGGIEQLLAFHRTMFGDARMDAGTSGTGDGGAAAGTGQGDQAGGQGDATAATSTGDTGDAAQAAQDAATAAATAAAAAQSVDDLPDWAQKIVRDARAEAASHRVSAKDAAQQATDAITQQLGKALGLVTDDATDAPKPEELTAQVQAAQAQARDAAVQLAVYRTASKHDGDPDALLDSRAFLQKVTDLDPAADDFATKVDAAIKTAVDTNPKLKTVQTAARSGQDFSGGTGEGRTRTPKSLTDAVASAYGN